MENLLLVRQNLIYVIMWIARFCKLNIMGLHSLKGCKTVVNEPSVNATNVFCFRYIRSGVEMLRMADTYFDEENHEKAYILYHKFVTLFVQKVLHNIFVTGSLFSPFIIVKKF